MPTFNFNCSLGSITGTVTYTISNNTVTFTYSITNPSPGTDVSISLSIFGVTGTANVIAPISGQGTYGWTENTTTINNTTSTGFTSGIPPINDATTVVDLPQTGDSFKYSLSFAKAGTFLCSRSFTLTNLGGLGKIG